MQPPAADPSVGRRAERLFGKRKAKPPLPPHAPTSGGFGSLWVLQEGLEPTQALPSPNFPAFFPSSHLPQSLRFPWNPCHRSPKTGGPIASAVSKELRTLSRIPYRFLTTPCNGIRSATDGTNPAKRRSLDPSCRSGIESRFERMQQAWCC